MIGLIALAAIAIWLMVVIHLCKRVPDWLGMTRFAKAAQFLLFPVLLLLPITDELIGMWQFERLCVRENVVHLSDDWQSVRRAKRIDTLFGRLNGYATRIEYMESRYEDMETGELFLHYRSFYNYGGLLMDRAGLRLSAATPSCWPSNINQVNKKINLQQLLDQGNNK